MHARCPPGSRIFSRFCIDILMNNDRKYTCDFERALHENMNYVSIDPHPWASMRWVTSPHPVVQVSSQESIVEVSLDPTDPGDLEKAY